MKDRLSEGKSALSGTRELRFINWEKKEGGGNLSSYKKAPARSRIDKWKKRGWDIVGVNLLFRRERILRRAKKKGKTHHKTARLLSFFGRDDGRQLGARPSSRRGKNGKMPLL